MSKENTMNQFRKWLPKTTADTVISIGFVLYLLGMVLHEILFSNTEPFSLVGNKLIAEWSLRLLRDIGFAIGFSGMVSFGIRTLRREGFSLKRFLMPLIALVFLFSTSAICFYASSMMKGLFEKDDSLILDIEKFTKKINDETIPLTERSKYSLFYARFKYDEEGKLIKYLTPDGQTRVFKPSEKQINTREEVLQSKSRLKWVSASLNRAGFVWAIISLSSVLLGFFPSSKRTSNHNFKRTDGAESLPE